MVVEVAVAAAVVVIIVVVVVVVVVVVNSSSCKVIIMNGRCTLIYKVYSQKLEALRVHRPPWLRQIITPILPTVKMLSLGGERLLPPPLPPKKERKKRKKVLDHYLHHDLGMLPLLWWFFTHLLIFEYPVHYQNLISSSLYYPGPLHKISSQSVHNFLSNVVLRQTDRQTNRQTNATKIITSFAKEVIKESTVSFLNWSSDHTRS